MIVGLLTQETTTFKGRYYQLSDARNEPKPVQHPHPPICVGGSGERRTLRTAARFVQHWNFVGGTRRSSPGSATSCISTARTSAATLRRFSSRVTFSSQGTRMPPPSRPPNWQRSVPSSALSTSDPPWIRACSSRWPLPCVSSKGRTATPDQVRLHPSGMVRVTARPDQTPGPPPDQWVLLGLHRLGAEVSFSFRLSIRRRC